MIFFIAVLACDARSGDTRTTESGAFVEQECLTLQTGMSRDAADKILSALHAEDFVSSFKYMPSPEGKDHDEPVPGFYTLPNGIFLQFFYTKKDETTVNAMLLPDASVFCAKKRPHDLYEADKISFTGKSMAIDFIDTTNDDILIHVGMAKDEAQRKIDLAGLKEQAQSGVLEKLSVSGDCFEYALNTGSGLVVCYSKKENVIEKLFLVRWDLPVEFQIINLRKKYDFTYSEFSGYAWMPAPSGRQADDADDRLHD